MRVLKLVGFAYLSSIIILSNSAVAEDGPFGVSMGSDIAKFSNCTKGDTEGVYYCTKLPKSHAAFQAYALQYHEKTGVCSIKAVGEFINDNGYGIEIKSELEKIVAQISTKYGNDYEHFDILVPNATWGDAQYWLKSIKQKERIFAYMWSKESGFTPRAGVTSIIAQISATASNEGLVMVQFFFSNRDECLEEISNEQSKSF